MCSRGNICKLGYLMVVIEFQGSLPGAQGGRNPPVMGCVLGEPRSALPDIMFNHANSKPRSDIFCFPFATSVRFVPLRILIRMTQDC